MNIVSKLSLSFKFCLKSKKILFQKFQHSYFFVNFRRLERKILKDTNCTANKLFASEKLGILPMKILKFKRATCYTAARNITLS